MRDSVFAAALLAIVACAAPSGSISLGAEAEKALDEVLEQAVANGYVPGVVAFVTDRERVLYRGTFGVMDESGGEPMREDAIFPIFSMTKPITSLGVMMLVEQGLVVLDDPVELYLPEFADRQVLVGISPSTSTVTTRSPTRPVTVRDLLRHTSGIAYTFSSTELLEWTQRTGRPVLEQPLLHDPGARWTYGSSTYFLGRIIERVSDQALDQFLSARILTPLGMTDTSYDLPPDQADRLVALHRRVDGQLVGDPRPDPYQPNVRGDGGLLSTARDYSRFVQLILARGDVEGVRLVSPETVADMSRDHLEGITVTTQPGAIPDVSNPFPLGAGSDGFGLGFQVAARQDEGRAPGSLSWAGLRNTHFWIDPATGIGVVFLTQVLPFYDDAVIDVLSTFERTLYDHIE